MFNGEIFDTLTSTIAKLETELSALNDLVGSWTDEEETATVIEKLLELISKISDAQGDCSGLQEAEVAADTDDIDSLTDELNEVSTELNNVTSQLGTVSAVMWVLFAVVILMLAGGAAYVVVTLKKRR